MATNESHGPPKGDLLGLAPFGEAAKVMAEGAVKTAQEFFAAVCLPAATEVGSMLRDQMRAWRARNLERIALKSQRYVAITADGVQLCAHPRIVMGIIEHGSSADDELMQDKWAGLLASACTPDGKDESNLMFLDLLNRLTSSQARLLDHVCQKSKKVKDEWGIASALPFGASYDELKAIMGLEDVQQIDRELQHLRSLELVTDNGFIENFQKSNERRLEGIKPERLALHFYVRCQGSRLSPAEFFSVAETIRSGP